MRTYLCHALFHALVANSFASPTPSHTYTRSRSHVHDQTAKEEKAKRPPSAYNVFMKDKLTAYKANHPELSHKDAFKAVRVSLFLFLVLLVTFSLRRVFLSRLYMSTPTSTSN